MVQLTRCALVMLAVVMVNILAPPPGQAQDQANAQRPAFEVVSIKPVDPADSGRTIRLGDGDRVRLEGTTVRDLITIAYDVRDFQISGTPAWTDSDRYDVEGKAESWVGTITMDNLRPMLQDLLADRFKLALHHETKQLARYKLVLGKGGPKLQKNTAPGPPQGRMRPGQLTLQKAAISMLASRLAQELGRPVVDETGLSGNYDIALQWTPDEPQATMSPDSGNAPAISPSASGPSLFAAVQEQLGLKLESDKGPVDVLVIEHVENPSEN